MYWQPDGLNVHQEEGWTSVVGRMEVRGAMPYKGVRFVVAGHLLCQLDQRSGQP